MTCKCIDDLRPASFRGVGFFVDGDSETYGRRQVIHEYPMRDDPYVEDMGEKAQKITVNGYLFGDDWVAEKDALVAACRARGPALLQLPTEAPKMVACITLAVSRTKDACGFFSVKMEFVAAKNFTAPIAVGAIESLIGGLLTSSIPAFTTFYDAAYLAGNALSFVADNQVTRIAQLATDIISTVEGTPSLDMDTSTQIVQQAIGVYQLASAYASPGSTSAFLAEQPVAAQYISRVADGTGYTATGNGTGVTLSNGAAAIVPIVATLFNDLGNTLAADDALAVLTDYASWSVNETSLADISIDPQTQQPKIVSASDTANATNGSVFCGTVRSFALMKLAQAIAVKDFANRAEAIQARANVVELFNMQIAQFDEDAIVNILLQARDWAVQAVTQKMATLVPVITVSAPLSLPSLYWASRLYGDVSRAEELADRNNVKQPAFMPNTFEALAR